MAQAAKNSEQNRLLSLHLQADVRGIKFQEWQ